MITDEMNTLLTRTGPGTPMGELFRRYWIPALLDWELPEPDCPPVRVKLLGEKLIAFRDTEGRLGLIDEFCAHRGVSLWFGRNEECGLRCPYHGWKYDVTGQCVDLPSEPEESGMRPAHQAQVLPVRRGWAASIWAYMGPPAEQPPLPSFEWVHLPPVAPHRSPSAGRRATTCRRSKAASIRATSRSCTAATWPPIRSTGTPAARGW